MTNAWQGSGWFPSSFVGTADAQKMLELQTVVADCSKKIDEADAKSAAAESRAKALAQAAEEKARKASEAAEERARKVGAAAEDRARKAEESAKAKEASANERLKQAEAQITLAEAKARAGTSIEPPRSWQMKRQNKRQGWAMVDVHVSSSEHGEVVAAFLAGVSDPAIQVVRVERVQSIGLWQSYAIKLEAMRTRESERATIDRASALAPAQCERRWLWHGTRPDIAPKIVAQGFNRSFSGHNAVAYGRGVYFARDAQYSSSPTYSTPDASGMQRIFACRVAIGACTLGRPGIIVPGATHADPRQCHVVARDEAAGLLYDTTVDNPANPSIFVTYHGVLSPHLSELSPHLPPSIPSSGHCPVPSCRVSDVSRMPCCAQTHRPIPSTSSRSSARGIAAELPNTEDGTAGGSACSLASRGDDWSP